MGAQQCVAKGERDYASDLLTQCVVEDPGNLIYLQYFLSNLAQKFNNNKTGVRLSGFKKFNAPISASRTSSLF